MHSDWSDASYVHVTSLTFRLTFIVSAFHDVLQSMCVAYFPPTSALYLLVSSIQFNGVQSLYLPGHATYTVMRFRGTIRSVHVRTVKSQSSRAQSVK